MAVKSRTNQTRISGFLINVLTGVILWLLFAAVLAWMISDEYLNREDGKFVASLAQGVVACIVTLISCRASKGERRYAHLLAPLAYLAVQIVFSLLFWSVSFVGFARGTGVTALAMLLGFIVFKLANRPRQAKVFRKITR